MKSLLTRRSFLHLAGGTAALGAFAPGLLAQPNPTPTGTNPAPKGPPKPPALPPEKVSAVVGQAHRSLEKVRALVEETPLLVNACWDHGGGDFETALQAAAHTGRKEIALYLLSKQARLDVFAAAMLGHLDFVKAAYALDPKVHEIPGPHGFTLLHCARQLDESKHVVEWLLAHGAEDISKKPLNVIYPTA